MSGTNNNRTLRLHVRFTPAEWDKIQGPYKRSTCRTLSEYVRKVVLDKPVKINQRNQSLDDFMAELIALRNELSAIGNNYNQVVKRLHTMEHFSELPAWLLLNETAKKMMAQKVAEIKTKINSINDLWLRG